MDILIYIFKFVYRIRWWLIVVPILVTFLVIYKTRHMSLTFPVNMTTYTGVVSGFSIETGEGSAKTSTVVNNTLDNIISIITAKETLKEVSLNLYALHMIHGDTENDNNYITAENFRRLLAITPKDVKTLIEKTSLKKTVENLLAYEEPNPKNFVYGLFNWYHPHYSYNSLQKIQVKRIGNSDMLDISYETDDPGIAYQTLVLLNQVYTEEYHVLQYGTTNSGIRYFEQELTRIGKELRGREDSLTDYNVKNRIINYEEQTKQVAALDKDYELIYQDILLEYNSAQVSVAHLESQLDENVQFLKKNSEFISKLNHISDIQTRIATLEPFNKDSLSKNNQLLRSYRLQLAREEVDFKSLSDTFNDQKYTREGYPTSNFVSQWLDELLKLVKASSQIKVMESRKKLIDQQYTHFSPIGSTIKRQERNIDFMERSYLSILSSLNAARLRLKSLEMNSASLKIINPPTFPLRAEPTKRKQYVIAAYIGSLFFILGFFLMIEILDRTLRDKVRAERLTRGKVLGAFPGPLNLRKRKYQKAHRDKAIQHLSNMLLNHFSPGKTIIINLLSFDTGSGKSFIADLLLDLWERSNLKVKMLKWGRNFDPTSAQYMLASSIRDIETINGIEVLIVEHAALSLYNIPPCLLNEASVNLIIINAKTVWKDRDQLLFKELQTQCTQSPVFIYLNNANSEVVENFTGMLPPYGGLRKLFYRLYQLGLTSSTMN